MDLRGHITFALFVLWFVTFYLGYYVSLKVFKLGMGRSLIFKLGLSYTKARF